MVGALPGFGSLDVAAGDGNWRCPHGQGFIAATRMESAGKVVEATAREMVILPLFQRLAQHLQAPALELGLCVEEEDAVVRQTDLAGGGRAAAASHSSVAK